MIVVARGGGSLADLFAFCDETLCRTVALLRVPVISSVGHHTDRTLLDDVAAVACSTPTHAAETAVPVDCTAARAALADAAAPPRAPGPPRRARARPHARPPLARPGAPRRPPPHPPAPAPARAARRDPPRGRDRRAHDAVARRRRWRARRPPRPPPATGRPAARAPTPPRWTARPPPRSSAAAAIWTAMLATLAAHDPQRTLERGYALARGPAGRAGHERRGGARPAVLTVRLHDGRVTVRPAGTPQPTTRSTTPELAATCATAAVLNARTRPRRGGQRDDRLGTPWRSCRP